MKTRAHATHMYLVPKSKDKRGGFALCTEDQWTEFMRRKGGLDVAVKCGITCAKFVYREHYDLDEETGMVLPYKVVVWLVYNATQKDYMGAVVRFTNGTPTTLKKEHLPVINGDIVPNNLAPYDFVALKPFYDFRDDVPKWALDVPYAAVVKPFMDKLVAHKELITNTAEKYPADAKLHPFYEHYDGA